MHLQKKEGYHHRDEKHVFIYGYDYEHLLTLSVVYQNIEFVSFVNKDFFELLQVFGNLIKQVH